MRLPREDRYADLEPLLSKVAHPARYLGHEWGALEDQAGPFHFCMMYPDVYEVGQANLGIAILYNELNKAEGISCERAFLPWVDMAALMREADVPLLSLETSSPVASFDILGITLAHELVATNVVEALDLAGIPILSAERDEDDTLVVAGGPSAWNCEPLCPMFDAVLLGDGEDEVVDVARAVRDAREAGLTRAQILSELSRVQGVYVPSLYDVVVDGRSTRWGHAIPRPGSGAVPVVYKRCIPDLAATEAVPQRIVPYMGVVQDRLAIEVLRGCARGCRFCQAGITYRPVRERPYEQVVDAAVRGLRASGHDEVSLSSLSTTDHSQCPQMLRRLDERLGDEGVRVSIPSQRLDSFGVEMAAAVFRSRRGGLTFAPEAGTQRLRDVINKNVTDADLERAARNAFEQGWRRVKLYFMMGLPTETDADVVAIARAAKRVLDIGREVAGRGRRSAVTVAVSVAVFVPKAFTPFQWCGQLPMREVRRRQDLLLRSNRERDIHISYHDAKASVIEAVLSKAGREGFRLVLGAWRRGCRFDAWTDQFAYDLWVEAGRDMGIDLEALAAEPIPLDALLPWEQTSPGVSKGFLQREWRRAVAGVTTPDCTMETCVGCGVCPTLGVGNAIAGDRHAT